MRDVLVSKEEFRKSLRPLNDAKWVEITIDSIHGNQLDWQAVLKTGDGRTIRVQITPSQATYIVPGIKGLSDRMLFATPYQTIDRLAQAFSAHSTCVVLDTNIDRIVGGRAELRKIDGEIIYLTMAAGDALAYAALLGLPVYMVERLVDYLSDR